MTAADSTEDSGAEVEVIVAVEEADPEVAGKTRRRNGFPAPSLDAWCSRSESLIALHGEMARPLASISYSASSQS